MPSSTRRSPSSRIERRPAASAATKSCALGGAVVDQRAHLVVGHHQLVDAGAALVAGLAALGAAHRVPAAARVLALAVRAQLAHQALRQHAQQRRAEQEGLDAHVGQARDGARRVVGVQRGQHQVAGERGLDGDLRGLEVADLADHDHVRVLAQDGAQRLGEGRGRSSALTCVWPMPGSSYSIGSSTVSTLVLAVSMRPQRRRTAWSSCPSRWGR